MKRPKKSNIVFYSLVCFTAAILSTWIITITSFKNEENNILQGQIDSLIIVTNKLHLNDTTYSDASNFLPTKKVTDINKRERSFIIHLILILVTVLFVYLLIRCVADDRILNKKCFLVKRRKLKK